MDELCKYIGLRIRRARELLGMSQEDLAKRLGKVKNAVSSYETGVRTIKVTELQTLAQALRVPISYFFEDMSLEEASRTLNPNYQRLIKMLIRSLPNLEPNQGDLVEITLEVKSFEESEDSGHVILS